MKVTSLACIGLIGAVSASPLLKRQDASSVVASIASSATAASPMSGSASASAPASSSSSSSSSSQVQNATAPLNTTGITDVDILQAALALEALEISFYRIGLNFDEDQYESAGFDSTVRQRLTEIISEEQTHVSVIRQTIMDLGGMPNGYCDYAFPNVTDVKSFLQTTPMINGVGPGAYTGAAGLIQNGSLAITAASILSVEARHNAYARADVNKGDPFPQTFEAPLTLGQAYTVVSQFITSCPTNSTPLVVTSKPSLKVSPSAPYKAGDTITLRQGAAFGPAFGVGNATATPARNTTTEAITGDNLFAIFISGAMPQSYLSVPLNNGKAKIPQGVTDMSYVIVSSSATEVTDANTVAGPAPLEIPVPARTFSSANGNPSGRVKSGASS